jgi:hypothetical protein
MTALENRAFNNPGTDYAESPNPVYIIGSLAD